MTDNQFIEIKSRAWNWYKRGMREWSLATIKDFANAPQWAKDAICDYQSNEKVDFAFVVDCDDVNLLKKYDAQIDAMLLASQRGNFEVNFIKELLEFAEAKRDGDDYEMVDALCDMLITAMNANVINNTNTLSLARNFLSFGLEYSFSAIFCTFEIMGYDPYKCLLETVKELETRTGSWNEKEGKWCKDLGAYTIEEAKSKVSDKMWEKHHSLDSVEKSKEDDDYWYFDCEIDDGYYIDEKVKKWYKADYSGCKLAEHDPF